VAINLPLGFARSLDASWHVRTHGRRGKGASLGDILRALDSGQSLVEIEDVDATVRIWVE
jgi:hypothetical protein